MSEEEKKTTDELISGLRELREETARRRKQVHEANNELFKTVGELSTAQIQQGDDIRALAHRMSSLEGKLEEGFREITEQAQRNGNKAEAAVVVTHETSIKASRAIIENRVGAFVVSIVIIVVDYLSRR